GGVEAASGEGSAAGDEDGGGGIGRRGASNSRVMTISRSPEGASLKVSLPLISVSPGAWREAGYLLTSARWARKRCWQAMPSARTAGYSGSLRTSASKGSISIRG